MNLTLPNEHPRTSLSITVFAFIFLTTVIGVAPFASAIDVPTKFAIQIDSVNATIVYYMVPTAEQFPTDSVGVDITFPFAPESRYRLSEALVEVKSGDQIRKASLPWGFETSQVNWESLKSAFEGEVKKVHPTSNPPANSKVSKPGPLVPGSIQGKLSSADLQNLGKITSVIFIVSPDAITAAAATTAGALILLDDLTGKSGLKLEYNPFVGMTFVVPRNAEDAVKKVLNDVTGATLSPGVDGAKSLVEDLAAGRITTKTIVTCILPISMIAPPNVKKEIEKVIRTPGQAAKDAPANVEKEVRKFFKKPFG